MSEAVPAAATLLDFAGHMMKRCACSTLYNAKTPGDLCPECGGLSLHAAPDWVDATALYRAAFPAPDIAIIAAAHVGKDHLPRVA